MADKILETWSDNLTKAEIRALKTARTWGVKAYESILNRQNDTTKKTFYNSLKESFIQLTDRFTVNMYKKKIKSALNASYEENEDYFRLVELIMEKNCLECKLHGADCEIYQEFEEHCVPSPTLELEENCKYAYVKDTIKEIEKSKKGA